MSYSSKEYMREYYQKNREARKASADRYVESNPRYRMLSLAKSRARKAGLDFDLTLDDIQVPELCPYLGVKLTTTRGKGIVDTNMSLDRIDNTKGYIKGNVQVISRLANVMKSTASLEQLLAFAKGVLVVHSEQE